MSGGDAVGAVASGALAAPGDGAPGPCRPVLPALGPDLAYAVDRARNPRVGFAIAGFSGRERAQAEAALPAYEEACRPMLGECAAPSEIEEARRLVRGWLRAVAGAVRNPPEPKGLDLRAAAVLALCADLPAHLFDAASQRELMRSRFWPAAGDVDEVLRPRLGELVATRDALRRIAASKREGAARGPGQAPAPEPPPTDEERERIIARFRAEWAARAGRPTASGSVLPARVAAKHLTDGQLLANMEAIAAQGGPAAGAAALRAAALRRRLGRE